MSNNNIILGTMDQKDLDMPYNWNLRFDYLEAERKHIKASNRVTPTVEITGIYLF